MAFVVPEGFETEVLPPSWGVAAVAALLLSAALVLVRLPRHLARALYEEPRPVFGPWGLLDLLLVVLVGFLGLVTVGLLFAVAAPADSEGSGATQVVVQLASMVVALGPAALFAARLARLRGASALQSLGLRGALDPRAVLLAGMAYACFVPLFLCVAATWHKGLELLGRAPEPQDVVVMIAGVEGLWLLAAGFLAVVVVPALEELLFRGFLQPLLSRYLGAAGGVLLSSALFAALHGLDAFVPILALSLMLGWLRWRTGTLTASWIVHALHNGLTLALLLTVPEVRELILDQEGLLLR